jgi:general secretion pathway protein I
MLRRSKDLERDKAAGFTLVEALAALGVMAGGLAAIGALANSSLRVNLYTQRHLAEIETARKIMTGIPGRNALSNGRLTGVLDGENWRIDSAPLSSSLSGPNASWAPQSISLLVRSPSGAMVEIDTIRLRKQVVK